MLRMTVSVLLLLWSSVAVAQDDSFSRLEERSRDAMKWEEVRHELQKKNVDVQFKLQYGDVIPISMLRETETEGRGLLRLKWDQREVADVELLAVGDNLYVVLSVNGSMSLKAPLGAWHVENEEVPDFYTGPGVGGMIRGDLQQ